MRLGKIGRMVAVVGFVAGSVVSLGCKSSPGAGHYSAATYSAPTTQPIQTVSHVQQASMSPGTPTTNNIQPCSVG